MERLDNGDTILVPPIGPQVTVEGMVRRPAIYELKDEKDLASVLELAGGLLPTAALRQIEVQRLVAHEKQTMLSLNIPDAGDSTEVTKKLQSFQIQDGDRIRIFPDRLRKRRCGLSGRARRAAGPLFLSCGHAGHRRDRFLQGSAAGAGLAICGNYPAEPAGFSSQRGKLRSCRCPGKSFPGAGSAAHGHGANFQPV